MSATHWTGVLRARLREILDEVKAFDALRQEGDQLVAAMVAAGMDGIPDLPWKPQKNGRRGRFGKASVHGARQRKTYPRCSRCGRQFTNGTQYRGGVKYGTPPVCRDPATCVSPQVDVETN